MTPADLDELERLAKAATPGERVVGEYDDCGGYDCMTGGISISMDRGCIDLDCNTYGQKACEDAAPEQIAAITADAAYIAACSPDTVLRLVRAARALETIAGGWTNNFPGAPDVMATSPAEFRGAMWEWSQRCARAALKDKP